MPFELTAVANRQDPHDRPGRQERQPPTVSTMVLTGHLDADATEAILATVAKTSVDAHSILVELHDVVVDDGPALEALVDGLMSLREHGTEVQVWAREDVLQERLLKLPHSRDWLLWRPVDGSELPRKSLHVDGSVGPQL